MRRQSFMSRKQAGDTIVEVLIAIAVIATILVGAFLVSRTSLKQVRDSEERAQATNMVQGQLEQLRSIADSGTPAEKLQLKNLTDDCIVSGSIQSGAGCTNLGDNSLYDIDIDKTSETSYGTPPNDYKIYAYRATISWDSVNGGTSQVQLFYHAAID